MTQEQWRSLKIAHQAAKLALKLPAPVPQAVFHSKLTNRYFAAPAIWIPRNAERVLRVHRG